jgi:hypothetical protein
VNPTIPASPTPEALALAARLSTLKTNLAALAAALGKDA